MSDTMRLRVRAAAPVGDVHRALTDATALRAWLAEHATVDLPGTYEFWGRHTPEGDAPRQRPLHAGDHTLRFEWTLDGVDTTVEFSLEAESARSTIVTLTQTHLVSWADTLAETSARSVLHTFWALALANLVDHVEGRELTPKCDFTSPKMYEEILIDAPPEAVYDSLTDAAQFTRWFGAHVGIEPHVGGRFSMGGFEMDPVGAKIIDLEPGRKMTMRWEEGMTAGWELDGSGGRTRLTFVQSGFDEGHPPYGAWAGWLSGIAELRRFHELTGWRPIWLAVEVPGTPEGILAIG